MDDFVVLKRYECSWDIWGRGQRLYKIRGKQGNIHLLGCGEFEDKNERVFSSVESCMSEIIAEFMAEPESNKW